MLCALPLVTPSRGLARHQQQGHEQVSLSSWLQTKYILTLLSKKKMSILKNVRQFYSIGGRVPETGSNLDFQEQVSKPSTLRSLCQQDGDHLQDFLLFIDDFGIKDSWDFVSLVLTKSLIHPFLQGRLEERVFWVLPWKSVTYNVKERVKKCWQVQITEGPPLFEKHGSGVLTAGDLSPTWLRPSLSGSQGHWQTGYWASSTREWSLVMKKSQQSRGKLVLPPRSLQISPNLYQ